MRRSIPLLALFVGAGCSDLSQVEGGVVSLEVTAPNPAVLEVHESAQLSARALNSDGVAIAAPIVWSVADTTVAVDPSTGIVTGTAPGQGRVFASVGSLQSAVITFSVLAPADTIVIPGDSILTVTADQAASAPLLVRMDSFSPPGVVDGRPVIFTITSPDPSTTPLTVGLPNGLAEDTVATAADGTSSVVLTRLPAFVPPLTVVVTVRATRTHGATVPGSGQNFTVSFP